MVLTTTRRKRRRKVTTRSSLYKYTKMASYRKDFFLQSYIFLCLWGLLAPKKHKVWWQPKGCLRKAQKEQGHKYFFPFLNVDKQVFSPGRKKSASPAIFLSNLGHVVWLLLSSYLLLQIRGFQRILTCQRCFFNLLLLTSHFIKARHTKKSFKNAQVLYVRIF